jgi:hypothetical protein
MCHDRIGHQNFVIKQCLWRNYVRSCIRQNISQLMAFIYIYTTHSKFSKSGPCGNNYTAQRGNNYTTHIKLNSTILEITKKNNRSIACLLIPNPQPVASNMSIAWWSLILNLKETLPNNCQCTIFEIEVTIICYVQRTATTCICYIIQTYSTNTMLDLQEHKQRMQIQSCGSSIRPY